MASIYVDGTLVHQSDGSFTGDGRFRPYHTALPSASTVINPMQGFYLATGNVLVENSSGDLGSFLFVDRPMTQLEIQQAGAPSADGLLDATSHDAPHAGAVNALSPTHYYRLNESSFDTGSPTVVDVGMSPVTSQHEGNFPPAVAGSNGVWMSGFEKGNLALSHNDAGAVDLGSGGNFAAEQMTFSIWFKVKQPTYGVGGLYADRIFLNNDSSHQLGLYAWTEQTTGDDIGLVVSTDTDGAHSARLSSSVVNLHDGGWHHAVVLRHGDGTVLDGNSNPRADVSLIGDGVDYSSDLIQSGSSWGNTGTNAHIGTRSIGSIGNFAGTTDEVAVWLGDTLTVAEAQNLYNAARTPGSLPTYSQAVLDLDPIAYYRLNEPAGLTSGETVVNWANQGTTSTNVLGDACAGANENYPESAPTSGVAGPRLEDPIGGWSVAGLEADNTAAQFTGLQTGVANSADLVNIGVQPALMNSEDLTYSLLFNTSDANQYMRMLVTDPGATDPFCLIMDQGHLVLVLNGTDTTALDTDETFNDAQWHHVVAIREGDLASDMRLFVDGESIALTARGGGWTAASSARIGARDTGATGFRGLIDEVAIWNRALSNAEAQGLFLTLAVPEPTSVILLAFGGVLILPLLARRRRK